MTILGEAQRILDSESASGPRSPRLACWLARAALEDTVRELLRNKHCDPGTASMRSLLGCLEVAYQHQPDLATKAEFAWSALSRTAHHHAFELSPTLTEARHLVSLVRQIQASLAPDETSDTVATSRCAG